MRTSGHIVRRSFRQGVLNVLPQHVSCCSRHDPAMAWAKGMQGENTDLNGSWLNPSFLTVLPCWLRTPRCSPLGMTPVRLQSYTGRRLGESLSQTGPIARMLYLPGVRFMEELNWRSLV